MSADSTNHVILIRVFDDSREDDGGAFGGCGPCWTQVEITQKTIRNLRDRLADGVKLEYHDMSRDEERSAFGYIIEMSKKNLRFPIVEIDGKIELVGYIEFDTIASIVDAKLQAATELTKTP